MDLRLTAPSLDFWVEVRIRSFADRWIAVADIAGDQEVGLGYSASEAVANAMSSLGPDAALAFGLNLGTQLRPHR